MSAMKSAILPTNYQIFTQELRFQDGKYEDGGLIGCSAVKPSDENVSEVPATSIIKAMSNLRRLIPFIVWERLGTLVYVS